MEQRFLKQIAKTSNLGAQKKFVLVIEIILEKNMDLCMGTNSKALRVDTYGSRKVCSKIHEIEAKDY